MTRADAIERMQRLMNDCNRCPCIKEICKKRGVYDECMKEAEAFKMAIEALSTDIVRCKDCAKKEKERGYYPNGEVVHKDEACPLIEFRGKAEGHEFDYQFCCFGERKENERQG